MLSRTWAKEDLGNDYGARRLRMGEAMLKATLQVAMGAVLLAAMGTLPLRAQAPPSAPQATANCQNTGSFERWLGEFRKEAQASGISRATLAVALDGMTFDPSIVNRDRRQSFFAQSFPAFSAKLISSNRLQAGAAKLK